MIDRENALRLLVFILMLSVCFIFLCPVEVHAYFSENLNHDIPAGYYIEAELDTARNVLSGRESVEFFNLTDDTLDVIIFHLYPNAFRDTLTLIASSGKSMKSRIAGNPGYIDIDSVYVDESKPDSIKVEGTLLYIYPERALIPSTIVTIDLKFEIKIPPTILRYGYDENGNYLLSHWHPILIGYQKGKPVIFEYDYDGEFFSNFSYYDVRLSIPRDFILASTAPANQPDSSVDNRSYYSLSADSVIDFAFACGPAWRKESIKHNGVDIDIMYLSDNSKILPGLKESVTGSLDFLNNKLFRYPADNFSFVDFSPGPGGMELPRMVVMSFDLSRSLSEMDLMNTAIHETAHQWFYAVIATNEYEEAWLDEGFVSYLSDRVMFDIYGKAPMIDFFGIEVSFTDVSALTARYAKALTPLAFASNQFHGRDYYMNVYGRAAAVIKTLEGVLGTEVFDMTLKEYSEKYKFKHPDSYDLQESFEKSAGRQLDRFFDDYVFGTAKVDYEITEIRSEKIDDLYKTVIEIQRNYDGVLPQNLIVGLADGTNRDKFWDGQAKYAEFEFESGSPATWAAVDTGYFYLIDEDLANNSRRAQPETGTIFGLAAGFGFVAQLILLILGVL